MEMDVQGGFSQTLSGEIGLSEIQIVFVNVFICPETMKWNPESLRETHFEATVAHSEFSWKFGRKSKPNRKWSGRDPWLCSKWGEGAPRASANWGPAVPSREMDVLSEAQPERLVCQKFKSFLLRFPFVPKR